jgi:excisionase family DNA binding protein
MQTQKLLRSEHVADRLGICLSLAYRLMRTGQIPSVRFGRTVRCREEDLEGFIRRNLHSEFDKFISTPASKMNIKQ